VSPFSAGVLVSTNLPASTNPQVKTRFEDRFTNVQNLSREQSYGMSTSMMANLHNNASACWNKMCLTLPLRVLMITRY